MIEPKLIKVSYTIDTEVEVEGSACGNCGYPAPDPPPELLEDIARKFHSDKRNFQNAQSKPYLKVGSMSWGHWMPIGWTAGQHPKVPLLCPECTAAVVQALEARKTK